MPGHHSDITTKVLPSEIHLTRTLDAPRELVWKAWTTPAHVAQWWGPRGYSTTTQQHDLRAGGLWRFTVHGPDGRDYINLITYLEVRAPEFLSYKHGGDVEGEPVNFTVTVAFIAEGEKTTLDMRMVFPSESTMEFVMREYGALEGGRQTLTRLGEHLDLLYNVEYIASLPIEFRTQRVFRTTRTAVFGLWTNRDKFSKLWTYRKVDAGVLTFSPQVGGMIHFRQPPVGKGVADSFLRFDILELGPDSRLTFSATFADDAARPCVLPLFSVWPSTFHVSLTFGDHAGLGRGTLVEVAMHAVKATGFQPEMLREGYSAFNAIWGAIFDRMAAQVEI